MTALLDASIAPLLLSPQFLRLFQMDNDEQVAPLLGVCQFVILLNSYFYRSVFLEIFRLLQYLLENFIIPLRRVAILIE